jgi:hypothetical protein
MSVPTFAVFFAFSLKTDGGEPNWPVTAYISGIVLGLLWMVDELSVAASWYRRLSLGGMAMACLAGLLLVVLVHFSTWVHPVLEPFAGPATVDQPVPLRRLDPTLRLRGWRDLASQVDQLRHALREQGGEPVLAALGWSVPGLLAFYCEDHPAVYTLGSALGDRRSQYDFWRPNPLGDPEEFVGRTFLIVSAAPAKLAEAFESVETHRIASRMENGQPVAEWLIFVCRGYKGMSPPKDNQRF